MNNLSKNFAFFCASTLTAIGTAHAQGPGGGMPPASVRVAEAEIRELAPTIEVPGTIYSRFDARIAAEVAGQLVAIADIGEFVNKGEPVARVDDTQLSLQQAEDEGQVARARSRIAFLSREVGRLQKLASQNVAAKSQLDQTESDLQVARQDQRIAAARLGRTNDQLERAQVRAPFSGIVSERFKVLGERVSIGDEVVRLVNQELIEVVARAPLDSVSYVAPGDTLSVLNARRKSSGTVRTLVPVGDPRTHMFEVRLDVPAEEWRIGETVRLVVPTQAVRALLAVPQDALVLRRDGVAVFRVNAENTAERIKVAPGVSSGGWVEVTGDIAEGDRVIVRGAERLQPGQSVTIVGGLPAQASQTGTAAR